MRKEPTAEQRAAALERRARFRQLVKKIADMSDLDRAKLTANCGPVTVEGRALSVFNTCLLITQQPTATVVGGFRQWIKAGRSVKKGEHGAMIWCPSCPSKGTHEPEPAEPQPEPHAVEIEGSSESMRFIIGTVFDISQTEERAAGAA